MDVSEFQRIMNYSNLVAKMNGGRGRAEVEEFGKIVDTAITEGDVTELEASLLRTKYAQLLGNVR